VQVTALRPKSKGKVELRGKDPLEKPLIYGNYLDENEDIENLIRGISIIKRMALTNTSRDREVFFIKTNISGCAHLEFDEIGYWECYVKHMTQTSYNPSGTAKMGPESDKLAVVDDRLNVKGVKGLRVIDASIMPNIVRSNINAAVVMIAEKGSDLIKEDWGELKPKKPHTEL
jgi:choline dehydrogenase